MDLVMDLKLDIQMKNSYKEIYAYIERYIPDNRENLVKPEHVRESVTKLLDALTDNFRFGGIVTPEIDIPKPAANTWYLASKAGTYSNGAVIEKEGLYIIRDNIDAVKVFVEPLLDAATNSDLNTFIEAQSAVDSAQDKVIASKADKLDLEDFKEEQNVINSWQDIEISKTKQELNQIKNSLSTIGQGEIGTAEGGGVISLPENVQSSVAPSYKLEGVTVQNLVNGDFIDGKLTDDFVAFGRTELEQGEGHLIVKTNIDYGGFISSAKGSIPKGVINEGDKIYLFSFAKQEKGGRYYLFLYGVRGSGVISNDWALNSSILEAVAYESYPVGIRSLEFKEGDDFETLYVKTFGVLNLTQTFGAGNEPTKEWCDANLPDYFEGVKSVQAPMRIKSVGENLFNAFGGIVLRGSGIIPAQYGEELGPNKIKRWNNSVQSDAYGYKMYLTTGSYYLSFSPTYSGKFTGNFGILHNINGNVIGNFSSNKKLSIEENGYYYLTFGCTSRGGGRENGNSHTDYAIFDNISFSKVSYDFKPYTESNLYINNQLELKSVGTAKDYIENGKLYKNVSNDVYIEDIKYILGINEKDLENVYKIHISKLEIDKLAGKENEAIISLNLPNIYDYVLDKPHFYISNNNMHLYLDKNLFNNTLPSKQDVLNYLVNNKVFVRGELEETEVINLDTSGQIVNHPNGTIFIEPVTNLTAFYNDGLDVSKLTIKEVESFSVFKDGNYQDLDVSKVSIKDGKLTHPDAVNGLCYLVYRYDDSPIYGINSVDYYNSDKTLKSPNGKIWKKVERATDDGKLEVVLEEVNKEG